MSKGGKHLAKPDANKYSKKESRVPVKPAVKSAISKAEENVNAQKSSGFAAAFHGWKKRIASPKFWLWLVIGTLLLLPLSIFPMFTIYVQNAKALTLESIVSPIITSLKYYLAVYLLLAFITARPSFSALLAGVSVYFFINFGSFSGIFKNFLPNTVAYIVTLLVGIVAIVLIFLLLSKFKEDAQLLNFFSAVLTGVLCFFLIFNAFAVRSELVNDLQKSEDTVIKAGVKENMSQEEVYEDVEKLAEESKNAKEKLLMENLSYGSPNLYVFVVDEMGGFSSMEKYYGYDFTEFRKFLEANNVNYSNNSHSMQTATNKAMTDFCFYTEHYADNNRLNNYLNQDTPLNQTLTDLGFSLYNLSVGARIFKGIPNLLDSLDGIQDDRTEDGLTVEDIAYENSIMQLLLEKREPYESSASEELLSSEEIVSHENMQYLPWDMAYMVNRVVTVFDYFENPESYIPNAGLGLFTYLKTTHVPFLFRADGSVIGRADDFRNWKDPEVYLGGYTFTLRHIELIIDTILSNDPDSIILVTSDHGVRWHTNATLRHQFEIIEEDQRNIMNLLYYRGQALDIEGLSGTDTIRVILNLLGHEIELEGGKTMDDVLMKEEGSAVA